MHVVSYVKSSKFVFITFFATLYILAILRYSSFHSHYYDLGIFQSNLYSIWNNGEWERAITGHVQPLLLVYSFIYNIFGTNLGVYLLLATQSFFLSVPVYMLGKIYKLNIIIIYALFSGVWYAALFDFHIDHLIVPLLTLVYIYMDRGDYKKVIAISLLILLVKEPYSLVSLFVGFYLLLKRKPYHGMFLCVASIIYFYFTTTYILNVFTNTPVIPGSVSAYGWLGSSFLEIIHSVFFRLDDILVHIFTNKNKILFIVILLMSFSFYPVISLVRLVPVIPLFALSLLSQLENYYAYANHYMAAFAIPLLFSYIDTEKRINFYFYRKKITKYIKLLSLITPLIAHFLFSPSPISRFFVDDKVYSWSYTSYIYDADHKEKISALEQYIPEDPNVSISVQNPVNHGLLSNRVIYLSFPTGVIEPYTPPEYINREKFVYVDNIYADYVVIDMSKPWYLDDKSCSWIYGECTDFERGSNFMDSINKLSSSYDVIYQKNSFFIYKI